MRKFISDNFKYILIVVGVGGIIRITIGSNEIIKWYDQRRSKKNRTNR